MDTIKINSSKLFKTFGKIIILEGDSNAFNDYNHLALEFKKFYEEDNIIAYDNLWSKNAKEIKEIFLSIFSIREPISIVVYTTGTRREKLDAMFDIAKKAYLEKKSHNVKYLIEQYDKCFFEDISMSLDIDYISNMDFLDSEDGILDIEVQRANCDN